MKWLLKLIQFLYCIYALIMFIIIMLIAFPFILIAAAFGIKGGNFIYTICRLWARIWYFFVGIFHKEIYEAAHDKHKQYIFVGNHISYLDIPPIVTTIKQPVRALGKYEMVKVPIFGQIYRTCVVLVDRSSAEKRAKSVRALKVTLHHGISIFLFPEGTFNVTGKPLKDFYDGAFKIAIETQTSIKPLLFIDTLKRMHYRTIFSLTPGENRVVFLKEINVTGMTMQDLPTLKQQVYNAMEEGLKRYIEY
ncbi:MAG: 1-acyl-sn-glycerol-3-phosphate acyltransferase [Chitinophagaceae bacterium]|nr:1-acyl-sn-glycerol-3-phosphate acyltransferase [Chitinophagaceae bacterium]MCW5904475.1 1-acyl-sn-glycerol-3-phosphate acyltransferase [Chitinophagaceae bacterium]